MYSIVKSVSIHTVANVLAYVLGITLTGIQYLAFNLVHQNKTEHYTLKL